MKLTNKQALDAYNEIVEAFVSNEPLPVNAVNLLIYSIQDLQVRDYVLGHAPITFGPQGAINFISALLPLIEEGHRSPFYTILSAFYYEAGDRELAYVSLVQAQVLDKDYSLAKLLDRVYKSEMFNPENFAEMRRELHPKVLEEFAEEKELQIA